MKNLMSGMAAATIFLMIVGCGMTNTDNSNNASTPVNGTSNTNAVAPAKEAAPTATAHNAFEISGTIDDAVQKGKVCDTSKAFTVPGTLEFKFTPSDARSGNYTYTGPFNAKGEGPCKINEDGTMKVDGTGCILGKCATYSHNWKAKPIDPTNCDN